MQSVGQKKNKTHRKMPQCYNYKSAQYKVEPIAKIKSRVGIFLLKFHLNDSSRSLVPVGNCWRSKEEIFVTASHQTGLDTRSMTRRSIIVGVRGGKGRGRAEARARLDYDTTRPPEGGPAETGGLTASSLLLLDCALEE